MINKKTFLYKAAVEKQGWYLCREMNMLKEDLCYNPLKSICQAMILRNSKNRTQGNAVLSDLNEASPRRADKENLLRPCNSRTQI
jgi:hypothetical protein